MAYAAAASLSHTIDLLLNYHQNSFNPKFINQILSFQKHTKFLLSFLQDHPDRASIWEEVIRDAADMAEEYIELSLSDSLLGYSIGSSSTSNFEKGNKYQLPYGFDEVERVTHQIESIINRMKGIHSDALEGPDHELVNVISALRSKPSFREIIAIYGREGMGKTTLATNAYDHPSIVEHFDVRAWYTVSTEYGRSQFASQLRRTMKFRNSSRSSSEEEVDKSLYDYLHGRKYLIVLDDVRNFDDLKRLEKMLPFDEENGSRILITTRFFGFAKSYPFFHQMGLWDVDKTWESLRKRIFKRGPCPCELEHIGKKIAVSCKGNPLSIELVSGILAAADQTVAAWEDISEKIEIASEDVGKEITEVLSLSYAYLPHHLRPCFLYLGIFPKNEEMRVSRVVKLWVAEGFLNESECKSFEEIGEECVEDLVRRNLVSVSKRKSDGRIKSLMIHGAMRDMCLRQAHKYNFVLDLDQQAVMVEHQSCRRVSTYTCNNDFLEGIYGSTVRTMILYAKCICSIRNAILLRILDLSNTSYNYDLPEEVYELIHLRYLAFNCGFSISEAISNLENLQTLIICTRENSTVFDDLPEGIWRMPQLRHLFMSSFKFPAQKGATIALENLQTLSRVVDFACSRENLKMIANIRKLVLLYAESFRDVAVDYELHNLIYLQKLENLKVEISCFSGEWHKMSFDFPPTLKKLSLSNVGLPWEDMKIVASLPSLEVLKLRKHGCVGKTWETSKGGFSKLTFLLIEESNLESWISERSHFPRLKSLVLRSCVGLSGLPSDMLRYSSLELIELDHENQSLLSSAKQIQENRHNLGDDRFQVRLV